MKYKSVKYPKKRNQSKILQIVNFILLLISILFLVMNMNLHMKNKEEIDALNKDLGNIRNPQQELKNITASEQEIIENCRNLTFDYTSKCLIENIKPFYKFKDIPDNETLTFEELRDEGGDCREWSFLYERLGKELNFNTYTFGIEGHRFAVIQSINGSRQGYCILDQTQSKCFSLSGGQTNG